MILPQVFNATTFPAFCTSVMQQEPEATIPRPVATASSVNVTYSTCSSIDYAFTGASKFGISTNTAYFYFVVSNKTGGAVTTEYFLTLAASYAYESETESPSAYIRQAVSHDYVSYSAGRTRSPLFVAITFALLGA
ncbi:hypothetical protein M422DRAFT_46852 [Sphaerobolus stellatus SS14]|uniref:Uncharacterized protein n=1 Tax=Sphaerobolus stellatus (strain SS14) TaxID=990650 RepID=A0A0C9W1P8_SPHS4|nr:hypothetical protein M422DRAFT_46852 [Sphaerobolus stellatus SS14]